MQTFTQPTLRSASPSRVLLLSFAIAVGCGSPLPTETDSEEDCQSCGSYMEDTSAEPAPICEGPSSDLVSDILTCMCDGACEAVCVSGCDGNGMSDDCGDCMFAENGCGSEVDACLADK